MTTYQEMYRLPMINPSVPITQLDLPTENDTGFMYRLPQIQGTCLQDTKPDVLQQLEVRQDSILKQLESLKLRVESLSGNSMPRINDKSCLLDIVMHSGYQTLPHSVPIACRWLQNQAGLKIFTSSHVHSSVKKSLQHLGDFLPSSNCESRVDADIRITIIWKEGVSRDLETFVALLPDIKIKGEVNLLRFLNRQFGLLSGPASKGEPATEAKFDEWLDRIHSSIIWSESEDGSIAQSSNLQLILEDIGKIASKQTFLQQAKEPGLVDLIAFASIKGILPSKSQPKMIQQYMNSCRRYFEPSINDVAHPVGVAT